MIWAYDLHPRQIEGGPSWLGTEKFDIVAEAGGRDRHPTRAQFAIMLQKLLTERFGLTFHREERQMADYVLALGKNPLKIEKSGPATADISGSTFFKGAGPSRHLQLRRS